jgi:hypothetical protein
MNEQDTRSERLRTLTEEAREHLVPTMLGQARELEWSRIEAGLERELAQQTQRSTWIRRFGVLAIAAGAIAWLGIGTGKTHATLHTERRTEAPTVVSQTVRNLGDVVANATELRSGDTLRVTGAGRVVLAQDAFGKHIEWSLAARGPEGIGVARLTKRDGALHLALQQGSVECDVEPGSSTPIFLVEAGETRVVVRGTHFRVERKDDMVRVDLTRGKVSVEQSDGSTRQLLAPAHVSIQKRDGRFDVTEDNAVMPEEGFLALSSAVAPQPIKNTSVKVASPVSRAELTERMKACVEKGLPRGGTAGVSLETVLAVTLDGSGTPIAHQFDPPLPPEADKCANDLLRNRVFTEHGTVLRLPFQVAR